MLNIEDIKPGNLLSYMDDKSFIIVEDVHGNTIKIIKSARVVSNRPVQLGNLAGVKVTKENLFKKPGKKTT